MRMVDGVCGCICELLALLLVLLLLLLLRGKNTSPFAFGCEHDGLGGGLVSMFGDPREKFRNKNV